MKKKHARGKKEKKEWAAISSKLAMFNLSTAKKGERENDLTIAPLPDLGRS